MSIPPISSAAPLPPLVARGSQAAVPQPLDTVGSSAATVLDARSAVEAIIHKPWLEVPEALRGLAEVRDHADGEAMAVLKAAERNGIWWDGGDSAVRQDLALLRHDLPAHADIVDVAQGYQRLMEVEKSAHSDPTPHARLAAREIVPRLRQGESASDAAESYGDLRRYCARSEIDAGRHALEAYRRIDAALLDCQTRKVATAEYLQDPQTFEQRQQAEKTRFEARQAEVKRVAEQVSREPREDLRITSDGDEWLVVGGVRIPRRQ